MQPCIDFVPRANFVDTVKGAEHLKSLLDSIDDTPKSFFETFVGPPIKYCNEFSAPLASNDLIPCALKTENVGLKEFHTAAALQPYNGLAASESCLRAEESKDLAFDRNCSINSSD